MKKAITLLFVFVLLVSCAPATPGPAAIQTAIVQTLAAQPTATAVATQTAYPTLAPASTYTPYPTLAPNPTYTPANTHTAIVMVVTATSSPTPLFTPTITLTPSVTLKPTATKDPSKNDRGPGFYLIGKDIAPGVWRNNGTSDKCYWKVSGKTGNIVSNHFGMSGGTAYIPSTGYQVEFTNECGTWTWLSD